MVDPLASIGVKKIVRNFHRLQSSLIIGSGVLDADVDLIVQHILCET